MDILNDLTFCVFDLETTGPALDKDDIIEIGLVEIKNLKITNSKSFLIRPHGRIPKFIQNLTSIKDIDVSNAPTIENVIDEILSFMGNSILVAHNSNFDVTFFNTTLKRLHRKPLDNKVLCTNIMTKHLIPELINSNLPYLCKLLQVPQKRAHRALADATATANILLKYLDMFLKRGIKKINHLYYPQNRYETDRITYHFKDKDLALLKIKEIKNPMVAAIKDAKGVILFSLPFEAVDKNKDILIEKVLNTTWESLSIRIFANFFQAIVTYYSSYYKLNSSKREESIELLKKEHLSKYDNKCTNSFDFLITYHLIPGQYLIYPLLSFTPKSGLCFKYPSQKNKIYQYIASKKKGKGVPVDSFITFIFNYIKEYSDEFYSFNQTTSKPLFEEMIAGFTKFIENNPYQSNYPLQHI